MNSETRRLTPRSAMAVLAIGAAVCLPVLLMPSFIARLAYRYELAGTSGSTIAFSGAAEVVFLFPIVSLASLALYLLPGALLALAMRHGRRWSEWLVWTGGLSPLLVILVSTVCKLTSGMPLTGNVFLAAWLGLSGLCAVALLARVLRGVELPNPFSETGARRRLLTCAAVILAGTVLLAPKLLWENFNLDGLEAFEFGRSLSHHLLPYGEIRPGAFGFYHNFALFAFPSHFFITVLGPSEIAARLPLFSYLVWLFAGIVMLVELGARRAIAGREEAVVWLSLASVTITLVYSATYEPFFTDIAGLTTPDMLAIGCFLATCCALWSGRLGWTVVFGTMTHLSSPGGLLLLLGLLVGVVLAGPRTIRERALPVAAAVTACLLIVMAYELWYQPLIAGGSGQFSTRNMARRLFPPTLRLERVAAFLIPAGIVPAISLAFVRRQDPLGWSIALAAVLGASVVGIQAWTNLHQFALFMPLAVIPFWRLYLAADERRQRLLLGLAAAGVVLSIALSLPRTFAVNVAVREAAVATEIAHGGLAGGTGGADRPDLVVGLLFIVDYRDQYPAQPWGVDGVTFLYYAAQPKRPGQRINYFLRSDSQPAPAGAVPVGTLDGYSAWVRDTVLWRRQREPPIPRTVIAPAYDPIMRHTALFFRTWRARPRA